MATYSVFLPGKSHGERSLVGFSPWDHKQLDMTEQLNNNNPETWRRIVSHHKQVDTLRKEHQLCGPSTWSLILVPPTDASLKLCVSRSLYINCRYYSHLLRLLWRVNDLLYTKCFGLFIGNSQSKLVLVIHSSYSMSAESCFYV